MEIEKPITVEKEDTFKSLFSKFGCIALDKQENLANLIGDLEGKLDLEEGVLTFGDDISFDVQILGYFTDDLNEWSWAWDNEEVGLDENLIKASKQIYEIGQENGISEFTTPLFETTFEACHIWSMAAVGLLDMDAYYGAKLDNLDIFVAIKSDLIKEDNSCLKFRDTYNSFIKNFNVFHRLAFEGYTKLKGYPFKEKQEFSLAKIGEDRIIVGFTERGNVTHIQMLTVD